MTSLLSSATLTLKELANQAFASSQLALVSCGLCEALLTLAGLSQVMLEHWCLSHVNSSLPMGYLVCFQS